MAKSILELLPEMENIIENNKEEVIIIDYIIDSSKNRIHIEYNRQNTSVCFNTKFNRFKLEGFDRNKDGTLQPMKMIDRALSEFRKYIEKVLEDDEDECLKNYKK